MYSFYMKQAPFHSRSSAALLLGYLALSTTIPFLLSYKETSTSSDNTIKGTISARSLFTKI
ncbi:hypothetical protein Cantr_05400 [Candida viswanathii]|uniref:Uncharacterized protein n=1 Tax=Candida viswanathii TaxID=5486 RepID=A0A367XSV1_9ASCO|nr:hypothetical protein Cantr_05400 [Candida viswanathii]